MIDIFVHKDWSFPDIMRQTPGCSGVWGDLQFTTSSFAFSCDLVVVLNAPTRHLLGRVRDNGLWLFTQESPIEIYRWHTRAFKYFDRVFSYWPADVSPNILHHQTALPWHINKTYDELKMISPEDDCKNKRDAVSWVTTNAASKQGHALRLGFLDFLRKCSFPFSLFGRGFAPIEDKFEGIHPYKYSIAIENYSCNDYWTEKIADCFLCRTMPIYWGAKNITQYFPEEAMILIDPARPEAALDTIKRALDSDRFTKNFEYIEMARELVLEKYQFFPHVENLLKKYPLGKKRKFYYLPSNTPPLKSFAICRL